MIDYARGLKAMKAQLPQEVQDQFSILEMRMLENIQRGRLYGNTPEGDAQRFAIVDALNKLAWEHGTKSFTEFASRPQTINVKPDLSLVQINILTRTIPTAYYHMLNTQDFPFIRITIDNAHSNSDDASFSIRAFIEDYSDQAKETVTIAKGERKEITLLPVLKHSALTTLTEVRRATLQYAIEQIFPTRRTIKEGSQSIYLMARNRAVLGIQAADGSITDLTKYLASWVTPNNSEVAVLGRQAAEYHPDGAFTAYQEGNTAEEKAESVRLQAKAIFHALKYKTGLSYAPATLSWEASPDQITQKVRLPGESLKERDANCLDGAVLFASLLERIAIEPLLIIIPGHAFVGWRVDDEVSDRYEFLDTTLIRKGGFEQAQAEAQARYDEARTGNYFERPLFYAWGFARLIDVVECRHNGIYPLE